MISGPDRSRVSIMIRNSRRPADPVRHNPKGLMPSTLHLSVPPLDVYIYLSRPVRYAIHQVGSQMIWSRSEQEVPYVNLGELSPRTLTDVQVEVAPPKHPHTNPTLWCQNIVFATTIFNRLFPCNYRAWLVNKSKTSCRKPEYGLNYSPTALGKFVRRL